LFGLTVAQGQTLRAIFFNPAGTDDGFEYVEIIHTPSTALTGLTLVEIDGDGASSGIINSAISLNSYTTGSNGILLIRDAASSPVWTPAPSAATNVVVFNFTPDIQNGTGTFLIVSGFTGTVGQDLDPENDGTLNTTPWTTVFSAVSVTDTAVPGDSQYADDAGGTNLPDIVGFAAEGFVLYSSVLYAVDVTGTGTGPYSVAAAWDAAATQNGTLNGLLLTPGNTDNTLPVNFGVVRAAQQGAGIKVEWSNLTETDVQQYHVERSGDGRNFNQIATIAARLNDGSKADYSFTDAAPLSGINYYRIQSVELSRETKYSLIVKVDTRSGDGKADIQVYPNPLTGNLLSLQTQRLGKGQYTIRITNAAGQQVLNRTLQHNGGSATESIPLPANLKAGMYSLQLIGDDLKLTRSFIIR
jgi:hypothetical protein